MKNKLIDLNDHLFAQLERLNDEDLDGEKLIVELERAKGISSIAKDIVNNARLALDGAKFKAEYQGQSAGHLPAMIGSDA